MKKAAKKKAAKKARNTARKEDGSGTDPGFLPIVAAFARDPHVSRRRMFSSSSVLSVNGKIFVMLVRGSLVAKLPKERVDELVSDGRGEHFDPGHGRLMKEWVAVPAGKVPWVELAAEAHRFVKGSG